MASFNHSQIPLRHLLLLVLVLVLLHGPHVQATDNISLQITGSLIEGRIGLPGDQALWEIVLTNQGIAPETNLLIVNSVPPELQIDDVVIPTGQVSIIGQSVVVALAELHPGESFRVKLKTIILSSPETGVLDMHVTLDGRDVFASTELQVARVTALPSTGATPWWRFWLLVIFGVFLVIGTVLSLCHLERATC